MADRDRRADDPRQLARPAGRDLPRPRGARRRRRQLTYAELEAEATRAARRLAARGVRRGATVALTLPRRPELRRSSLHALMKLGAVAYPLNPRLAARGARGRARRAPARRW